MFNIGPEKLFLLFAVALIVLGPEELPKAARQFGRWMAIARQLRDRVEGEVRGVADSLLTPPPDDPALEPREPHASPVPPPDTPSAALD